MKPENVSQVHSILDKFEKNLRFTVTFENEEPHSFGLQLSLEAITIFQKDTNTGLYINFTSFVPWTYTSWLRGLVTCASHICSTDKLLSEINTIEIFALWNDFPKSVDNPITIKTLITLSITEDFHDENETSNEVTIYFSVPYYGNKCCLNPVFTKSNQIAKKNNQLPSEFYVISPKSISYVAPKIKCQH